MLAVARFAEIGRCEQSIQTRSRDRLTLTNTERFPVISPRLKERTESPAIRGSIILAGGLCETRVNVASDLWHPTGCIKDADHGDYHHCYGDHYCFVSVGPFEYGHSSLPFVKRSLGLLFLGL